MKRLEEAYSGIAAYIHDTAVPVHRDATSELVPGECNDPNCWVGHFAEGMSRGGRVTKEEAARGIHRAFEGQYGESVRENYIRETVGTSSETRSLGRDR